MISTNTSRKQSKSNIPSGRRPLIQPQIDLWEHAALLYHAYEWQSAADAFELLAQSIHDLKERALCLLNVGLIRGRLGDMESALGALEEAYTLDPTLMITRFLIALINCRQAEYAKAVASVEMCLAGLGQNDIDYAPMGLDFVLERVSLISALREMRSAQFRAGIGEGTERSLVQIDSIPAECIFEAPQRLDNNLKIDEECQERQERLRDPLHIRSMPGSKDKIDTLGKQRRACTSPYWMHDPTSPASVLYIYQQGLSETTQDCPATATSSHVSPTSNLPSSSGPTPATSGKHRTWHRCPSTPYTPRDARVEAGSTRELARFIRSSGQKEPVDMLLPKDPRGEHESLDELSRFVQFSAPERMSVGLRPSASLAERQVVRTTTSDRPGFANGLMSNVIASAIAEEEDLAPISVPPKIYEPQALEFTTTGTNGVPVYGISPIPRPAPDLYRTLLPPPVSEDAELEMLQPTVYKPPTSNKRGTQSTEEIFPNSPSYIGNEETPSTPASSISSVYKGVTSFERKTLARQKTLRALEGSTHGSVWRTEISIKPLPPSPDSSGTVRSISTAELFEKVLGCARSHGR